MMNRKSDEQIDFRCSGRDFFKNTMAGFGKIAIFVHSSMAFPHVLVIVAILTCQETKYRARLRERYINIKRLLMAISSPSTPKHYAI